MTARSEYTEEEWQLLFLSPWIVGMAVSLAEPGGTIREVFSIAAITASVRERYPDNELLGAAWAGGAEGAHPSDLGAAAEPERAVATMLEGAVDTCRAVVKLLADRSREAEAQGFRHFLGDVALEAANATTTGGFFGLGGVRVTEAERRAVVVIREALDLEPLPDTSDALDVPGGSIDPE